jgi:hypothetical protein
MVKAGLRQAPQVGRFWKWFNGFAGEARPFPHPQSHSRVRGTPRFCNGEANSPQICPYEKARPKGRALMVPQRKALFS